ncbi:hypothetical protein ACWOFR_05365 [Carnobacterium gallinarum]|uniref:hypothetical protein n=1 Tax=Carnobacterium gallinarum TaxID=2749 RepID=UPI00055236C4|nr:hypothetical protein [Carnobacterium gallinarum]
MSRIEDYWDDRIIYNVVYVAANAEKPCKEEIIEFQKSLIFPAEVPEEVVRKLILNYFDNIIRITILDEVSEGLGLKIN